MSTLVIHEKDFQRSVIDLARRMRWKIAHFHDSRRQVRRADGATAYIGDQDAAGFPDLVLARAPRLIVVELKAEKGRVKPEQQAWLDALNDVRVAQLEHVGAPGPVCPANAVEVYVWRPSLWHEIEGLLR